MLVAWIKGEFGKKKSKNYGKEKLHSYNIKHTQKCFEQEKVFCGFSNFPQLEKNQAKKVSEVIAAKISVKIVKFGQKSLKYCLF